MFINDAFAQAAGAAAAPGSMAGTVVQLVLIFVIFYFLLIRPQQKKIKEHDAMLKTIIAGDKILTGGGIIATVKRVIPNNKNLDKTEDMAPQKLEVEIAAGVNVEIFRSTIREVIEFAERPSAAKAESATGKPGFKKNSHKKKSKAENLEK